MASVSSDPADPRSGSAPVATSAPPTVVKVVVAGGFGVGKTTLIGSISDIEPLRTEAAMSDGALAVDDPHRRTGKTETTVALDFGRIALPGNLWLYLFGTPGQERFRFMWDDTVRGALGAVVLVDTARLDDCFGAVDWFEQRRLPFLVAVNCFDGVARHRLDDVRTALGLPPGVPILYTDARSREATRHVLTRLVHHAIARLGGRA